MGGSPQLLRFFVAMDDETTSSLRAASSLAAWQSIEQQRHTLRFWIAAVATFPRDDGMCGGIARGRYAPAMTAVEGDHNN